MKGYSSVSRITGKPTGILGYDYDATSITIYFTSGAVYHYSVGSCGSVHIANMKKLADEQHELNTYVTKNKPPHEWKR